MKVSKVVDPKLIGMGLGVFAATFISAQMVDYLDDQPAVGELRTGNCGGRVDRWRFPSDGD